ncbi:MULTISPECIES: GGDEF domain-containing protein [unclassified Nitratiruptor]|uniref:GGDEF domain-containing protein n=1 Tax=unclassified Nitratiruptor TaxID=2624044 RepID=UPI001916A8DD|nr:MULTISPECIES: GGDEF domain-containing protein [unclassified Nitratiruptor]BCD60896.1 diguanylate cyclase [Nitratiruptor sp. YY08-10]BCD64828.1 diguanylate cyclase [Nitratiruptor sp. YY08-14]
MWKKHRLYYLFLILFVALIVLNTFSFQEFFVKRFTSEIAKTIDAEIENKLNATAAMAITIAHSSDAKTYIRTRKNSLYFQRLPFYYRKYTKFKNIKIYILDRSGNIIFFPVPNKRYKKMTEPLYVKLPVFNDTWIDCRGLHLISYAAVTAENKNQKKLGFIAIESQFNSISKNLEKIGVESIAVLDKDLAGKSMQVKHHIQNYKILNLEWNEELVDDLKEIGVKKIIVSKTPIIDHFKIYYRYPIKDRTGIVNGWILFSTSIKKLFLDFVTPKLAIENILLVLSFILLIYFNEKSKYFIIKDQVDYYHEILDNFKEMILIFEGYQVKYINRAVFEYLGKSDPEDIEKSFGDEWRVYILKDGKRKMMSWKHFIDTICQTKECILQVDIMDKRYFFQVIGKKIKENDCVAVFLDITDTYRSMEELQEIAYKDPLTGLYNRTLLQDIVHNLLRLKRKDEHLVLALVDIDHFKSINDEFGHDTGDEVLRYVAQLIKKRLRSEDYVFRIGGEEFLIVMKTRSIEKVLRILQSIRKYFASHPMKKLKKPVTISIGVTEFKPYESFKQAFKRVDEALYEAKRSGRNRLIYKGVEDDQ